jgi:predicted DNA-binding transcriptional regulator YafY
MNHPAGRVLTLLELLQSGGVRTAAELAERLEVDARTVRRYVDRLLDLDIPVESVRGRYGGYRLARGYRLPPLMLGDDEALAVLLGLLAGRRSGMTAALGTAGETAAAKIRRVLPARLSERLQGVLDSVAFTGGEPDQSPALDATVLLTVSDAVANRRPIAAGYTDRTGVRSERTLHPLAVVSHGNRWYLRALDQGSGEERTFRLDRIAGVRTLPGTFERAADSDPAQSLLESFATADYRYKVTVRVQGGVEQIRRRFPASVATIQPVGSDAESAGWHRLDIRAERLDWLPPTLAALDLPFVIERPAELRDLVLAFAERLAARARGGLA